MSVILSISEKTYQSLKEQAQKRELESVEQFLDKLTEQFETEAAAAREEELKRRREVGQDIQNFRKRMKDKYGVMPDSTPLIREDRMRG